MQGASFIDTNTGKYGKARGDDAKQEDQGMVHQQQRNLEKHSGYKAYTLFNEMKIIEKLSVTPTNIHYSQIDLGVPGIIC
ncbi:hypothetical protein ACNF40_05020 [Cuniculiplasma sp. SKW4]|uniref:hypothetical protein n=1 Tax=Cuniculiplasma sp. SKW4 TaxID=3400171 RepID=UPI003FD5674E